MMNSSIPIQTLYAKKQLETFLELAQGFDGKNASHELMVANDALLQAVIENPAILVEAAQVLPQLSVPAAALLALQMGRAIEETGPGVGSEVTGPAVVGLFLSWIRSFPLATSEATADSSVVTQDAMTTTRIACLPILVPAVVAHLGRMPSYRETLASEPGLTELLNEPRLSISRT